MRAREGGSGTMRERKVPRLDSPTAALVRVAAAVATGKVPELDARLAAAREARVPGLWIEELLLQSMLVVGYPLALVAFGAWRRVGGPAPCREVYGRAYHKLLVNLRALHPALEDLVLVDAYGKVIGRPGLDLKRRELCTVATTAVLGTADQLHSHLRGALNTGASGEEIEAVLGLVDGDLDAERRQLADEQWADVKKRKL